MHYCEHVVIQPDGVLLPASALRRVGIGANSKCWAVWLKYWKSTREGRHQNKTMPQHLAISPFHPDSWPCLLHISLKLDDKVGVVHQAMQALGVARVNILSHMFTPTGHNHGTFDCIATLPDLSGHPFIKTWRKLTRHERDTAAPKLQQHLATEWAPAVLKRIDGIESLLLKEDGGGRDGFLRPRFVYPKHGSNPDVIGLAFNPDLVPRRVRRQAKEQFVRAISITWLQYPAYYWLFGEAAQSIPMTTGAGGSRLVVADEDMLHVFHKGLQSSLHKKLGVAAALATIEPEACMIRAMPYRSDAERPHVVTIAHGYTRSSMKSKGDGAERRSCGLLGALTGAVCEAGGSIWQMSNHIRRLSKASDRSDITFVVTDARDTEYDGKPLAARLGIHLSPESLKGVLPPGVVTGEPDVRPLTCLTVFVSKRDTWWNQVDNTMPALVERLLAERGYLMDTSPSQNRAHDGDIRRDAIDAIQKCHGLLQIVPKEGSPKRPLPGENLQWMEFELGLAVGAGKPCEIALQTSNPSELHEWQTAYRTLNGVRVFMWDRGKQIEKSLRNAIQNLDKRIRGES